MHGFTQATPSFSGDVQKGLKLVLAVNNHVDNGRARCRLGKGCFPKPRMHLKVRENQGQIYITTVAIFVNFLTMSHTCKCNCCFDKKYGPHM